MNKHEKINYLELPAKNIQAAKQFFATVFGWSFVDYGVAYTAFANAGIDGGFFQSSLSTNTKNGSVLIVFYSKHLGQTQLKIKNAGGSITKPVYTFPGGSRFNFSDTNGNEYAVWSDISDES